MTLGRARELGPTLEIAAIRELRKIVSADGTWDATSAGWQRLKGTISEDLRYDVGPVLLARADKIASRWQEALNSDFGTRQGPALMDFFKSDLGQRYLAFQSRLSSIEEAGVIAVATKTTAPNGHSPPPRPGRALLRERRRLLGLGWNADTNRCCDDVLLWMAAQGKAIVRPEEIAEVAGPGLDALRADSLNDLDAFATFQQSAALVAVAATGRRILDETAAAGPGGPMEAIAAAIQRSEQAHEAEWRQAYQLIRTATRPDRPRQDRQEE